ncbi:NUMOD4 domain-containing protein [Chryseobacterium sp. JK1]|uniref:NUMOD4 domain-containing protein n=1 Tax=Chryseobacterium sp. JK1 TaxID=874294 RepID=UPI003D68465A
MKLPPNFEDLYVQEVLYNTSLKDLINERWKPIENYENYMISNYGRVKSRERLISTPRGKELKMRALIMKLIFVQRTNNYLENNTYNVHCSLSSDGKKHRKSVIRLVYYHFIEKFDYHDRSILITTKDSNSLHLHYRNLEKMSPHEIRLRMFEKNRAKNRKIIYMQAVSQYSTKGKLLVNFENMYAAGKEFNITPESIMDVIHKEFLTAGGFRWFLTSSPPSPEDFIVDNPAIIPGPLLNTSLWEKLSRPSVNKNSPPACMNLSLKDLPGEIWKIIPGLGKRFVISNQGRVKRLAGWTSAGKAVFLKEQVLSQMISQNSNGSYSLYCLVRHEGIKTRISIAKWVYFCFIEKFDIKSRAFIVVNTNTPAWNIDLSKLCLKNIYSVLRKM